MNKNPKTMSSQIKQKFLEFCDKSSFHGLPRILSSKNIFSQVFWVVASLASLSYCVYLVSNSVIDYYKREVVTKYETVHENQPPFPRVQFCGHDINKTKCKFATDSIDLSDCPETYKDPEFFCETFNANVSSPILNSKNYGLNRGLELELYANDLSLGIYVYIGNHSIQQERNIPWILISPGMRTTFVIKRIFEKRLGDPYSDCRINVTGSHKLDELSKEYYQSECIDYCEYYLKAMTCHMLDIFLEFSYLYHESISSFNDQFNSKILANCNKSLIDDAINDYNTNKYKACESICPVECNKFSFSISSFYFKLPDGDVDFAELEVFYESFDYTVISQTPKSTWDVVLGTIGGFIGLFLGASVLTVSEIIELMMDFIKIVLVSKFKATKSSVNEEITVFHVVNVNINESSFRKHRFFKVKPSMVTKVQRYGILSHLKNRKFRPDT